MPCLISDSISPARAGLPVSSSPINVPVFVQVNSIWVQYVPPYPFATTDINGNWSLSLPRPSESDPATGQWSITDPEGYVWVGIVPDDAGPHSIYDLKNLGWGLASVNGVGPVVTLAGPPGAPGTNGTSAVATTAASGVLKVDVDPASGDPIALTEAGTALPTGMLSATGPGADGAATVGTSSLAARADHIHPLTTTFGVEVSAPDFKVAGLTGAVAATRYVGGTTGGAPTTGTFAVGDFVIDQAGAVWICTAAPGTWTRAGNPSIDTSMYGFQAASCPVDSVVSNTKGASGSVYLIRVYVSAPFTCNTISFDVDVAGATLTASENYVGLYTDDGTKLLWTSAAMDTIFTQSGYHGLSTGGIALARGYYRVAFLANGTTLPAFGAANARLVNYPIAAAADYRYAYITGTATALPATFVPANLASAGTQIWTALS